MPRKDFSSDALDEPEQGDNCSKCKSVGSIVYDNIGVVTEIQEKDRRTGQITTKQIIKRNSNGDAETFKRRRCTKCGDKSR